MPYIPEEQQRKAEQEAGRQREQRSRLLRVILLVVFSGMVIYSLIRLGGYGLDLLNSRKTSQELRDAWEATDIPEVTAEAEGGTQNPTGTPEPAETATQAPANTAAPTEAPTPETDEKAAQAFGNRYPDNPKLKVSSRFQNLRKKSGYIMGWLKLDGVDEAVVQKDNTFFLNHDAMGNRNVNGAIFLDEGISLLDRPPCLLLYGHNMKTGAMFGNLKKFEQSGYAYKHRIITCDTLYEEGTFVVFAVGQISIVRGTARFADLYALTSLDEGVRQEALNSLIACDMTGSVTDVSAKDQLLLLITCTSDDDQRLVVAARRLREGEAEDNIQMKTLSRLTTP